MSITILRRAARSGFLGDARRTVACLTCLAALGMAQARGADSPSGNHVIHRLDSPVETLELTVNMSRILTIGKELPRVIVNNPEVAEVTALSPTQIQVMAKKAGVTQINLFDADDNIHSVDLIVYPDARELTMLLRTQFPTAALKVVPTANAVILSGYVDDPAQVQRIVDIASDYAPKVLNNIKVGGVQQVLLQCKVMEVSRTKLRNMGFDWGTTGKGGQGYATSSVGGLLNTLAQNSSSAAGGTSQVLSSATTSFGALQPASGAAQNMTFGVFSGQNRFFGVLNLLTQKSVAKVIAEPELVTVSGRPASFLVGGQVPYPSTASLGQVSFTFRNVGTQVDFVPIVLGNGAIRLEVRPQVSELDPSVGITFNGTTIPGYRMRQCDTGVEIRSGQTLALAGLVQSRVETSNNGLVFVSELPLIGIPFRRMQDSYNEIETLILVTPHLVDPMDACEVPPGGPGYAATFPDNCDLYVGGHVEVPNCLGPDMLGPYPNANGVFPPVSNGAWEETDPKKKPNAATPAPKPNGQPAEQQSRRPRAEPPRDIVDRPKPPALTASKSPKKNTAGFVRFDGKEPSNPSKPTVKPGASRQKKTPGFIGPTGYDLR